MQIVVIDLESSGLIPEKCNVIQFGAVIEDTLNPLPLSQLPTFEKLIEWPEYKADSTWALRQHYNIWDKLETFKFKDKEKKLANDIIEPNELGEFFYNWLFNNNVVKNKNSMINVAGKNFASFDWQHLKQVPDFFNWIRFSHKTIDPAILYWDPLTDERLPGLEDCLKRAKFEKKVNHTAVADCLDVIKLLRYKLEY